MAERELQLARRELELIRGMQQLNSTERNQPRRESAFHDLPRASIAAIADLDVSTAALVIIKFGKSSLS